MKLVMATNAQIFYGWLERHDYPDLEKQWGGGLLDACYKYWAVHATGGRGGKGGKQTARGAVWYHWGGATFNSMVIHLCAAPGLIITPNLIGDVYKAPELLGAARLYGYPINEGIARFAEAAGWERDENGDYSMDLPSRWARYRVRSENDGLSIRRAKGPGHLEARGADRGGSSEGQRGSDGSRPTSVGSVAASSSRE